ncbi:hypothetical protein QW131_33050 [Roseibium salinum]|nr:hypothetical protein [Roseibium salinum]
MVEELVEPGETAEVFGVQRLLLHREHLSRGFQPVPAGIPCEAPCNLDFH